VFEEPQRFDLYLGESHTGTLWDLLRPALPAGVQEFPGILPNGVAPVYERFGLVEPRHRPEIALEPCRKYRWTVRARWTSDSVTSATEWMGAWNTIGGSVDPRWQRRGIDFAGLASIEDSPLLFYAPFVTPSADGRQCPDR